MSTVTVKTICTCGQPEQPYASLHAGTCPVWAAHHNLNTPKEFTVDPELPTSDEDGNPVYTVIYRERGERTMTQIDFEQQIEADRCMSGVHVYDNLIPVQISSNLAWILNQH